MREGASRDRGARRGRGAGGCCRLDAEVSWLFWPAATPGLRPDTLAALAWWWARIATAATGPLRQLEYPRAASGQCRPVPGHPRPAPALAPAHRGYVIDVVGQALLACALGQSHRTIGADLGVPADTVRGWIRRVRGRAEWLRVPDLCWLMRSPRSERPRRPWSAGSACSHRRGRSSRYRLRAASRAPAQRLTSTHPAAQPCSQDRDSMTTAATP
jgi:hypothetical protein